MLFWVGKIVLRPNYVGKEKFIIYIDLSTTPLSLTTDIFCLLSLSAFSLLQAVAQVDFLVGDSGVFCTGAEYYCRWQRPIANLCSGNDNYFVSRILGYYVIVLRLLVVAQARKIIHCLNFGIFSIL